LLLLPLAYTVYLVLSILYLSILIALSPCCLQLSQFLRSARLRNQTLSLLPRSRLICLASQDLQNKPEVVRKRFKDSFCEKTGTNPLGFLLFTPKSLQYSLSSSAHLTRPLDKRDGGRHGLERSLERLPIDPLWNSERQLQSPHNRTDRVRRRVRRGRRVGAPSSGEHTFAD